MEEVKHEHLRGYARGHGAHDDEADRDKRGEGHEDARRYLAADERADRTSDEHEEPVGAGHESADCGRTGDEVGIGGGHERSALGRKPEVHGGGNADLDADVHEDRDDAEKAVTELKRREHRHILGRTALVGILDRDEGQYHERRGEDRERDVENEVDVRNDGVLDRKSVV